MNLELSLLQSPHTDINDIYHENHPLHHMLYEEFEEHDENMRYFYSDQCQRDMKEVMK